MNAETSTSATATHADIGGREEQQDRVAVFRSGEAHLLALADGMGGHQGGSLAAQRVVDAAAECFQAADANTPTELLTSIVNAAHEGINALGAEMGISPHSTCVLLHVTDAVVTWAHVGDSRLYRFQSGRLVGRTLDHSIVELKRLRGQISEQEMKVHPDQNRLYEALGGEDAPQPDFGSEPATMGDGFLLVSDGVWENVADSQLEAVFDAADLSVALERLAAQAKANGGPDCDNLSMAAFRRDQITSAEALEGVGDKWRLPGRHDG